MSLVNFYKDQVGVAVKNRSKLTSWIKAVVESHSRQLQSVDFIFTTDERLHKMNLNYLRHDTYTDILTFNQSDNPTFIEGEVYISVDRVRENAEVFNTTFDNELHRVMIHGVLHLLGHKDDTLSSKNKMRKSEDQYLVLLSQL